MDKSYITRKLEHQFKLQAQATGITGNLPIDAWVVAMRQTQQWKPEFISENKIKDIYAIYVYDANQHTYAMEMSPSYYLEPVDFVATSIEDGFGVSDEVWENVNTEFWADMDGQYYHVNEIDRIPESNSLIDQSAVKKHLGEYPVDYADSEDEEDRKVVYNDEWEHVKEYVAGNAQF